MEPQKRTVLIAALFVPIVFAVAAPSQAADEVTWTAADGMTLYGNVYSVEAGKAAPLVLLFHQAGGDARGEYANIIPRLLEAGYNVFAIDQRSGGSRFDGVNRTVAALDGRDYGYCDTYPDLEAALDQAKKLGFTGPRVAWGSSYSAALVLRLGAEHAQDLAGVLAFSPASGGPMASCKAEPFIPKLTLPALALRPASEMERDSVRQQFRLFEEHGIQTFVALNGVHGSSMLDADRVGDDVTPTWNVVMEFLAEAVSAAN
ncbi:MAG: alpha/beta fold hydrolase [bacterium]|nr:alpha/beta fold hydrolase [bacterium]